MKVKESKREYWRRHVEVGTNHPGGVAAYCRQESLLATSFHYWKCKFAGTRSVPAVVSPNFVPVSVSHVERDLPDPEWLARFVGEFLRGAE